MRYDGEIKRQAAVITAGAGSWEITPSAASMEQEEQTGSRARLKKRLSICISSTKHPQTQRHGEPLEDIANSHPLIRGWQYAL